MLVTRCCALHHSTWLHLLALRARIYHLRVETREGERWSTADVERPGEAKVGIPEKVKWGNGKEIEQKKKELAIRKAEKPPSIKSSVRLVWLAFKRLSMHSRPELDPHVVARGT